MPTTKALEDALRALGWSPTETQDSQLSRTWSHPELAELIIRVPRVQWLRPKMVRAILKRARVMNPYR